MHFSRRGLSLIEVLVTIALVSLLVSSVTFASLVILRSWHAESGYASNLQASSSASELMLKELRQAQEITLAGANQISFWLDLNSNGLKEAAVETLTYSWSAVSGEGLYRQVGTSAAQTLLAEVTNFLFTYRDANNQPTSDLALIRALDVDLATLTDSQALNLRFKVKVRNL